MDMTLACACDVTPAEIGSGFLAVDVRRPEGEEASAQARLQPSRIGQLTPGIATPRELEANTLKPGGHPSADAAEPGPESEPEEPVPDAVLAAREQLLSQLERAADEGLLTLAPEVLDETPRPIGTVDATDAGVPRIPAEARPPAAVAKAAPDLTAHLSVRDPAMPTDRDVAPVSEPAMACIDDDALDIASWVPSEPFLSALGVRRRGLVDASGELNAQAVEDLARLYISAGFGREASALISRAKLDAPAAEVLKDMARIIDGAVPNGPIQASTGCVGRVGLWRYAAGLSENAEPREDKALLSSLEELPAVPRRIIAATVVRQALAQDRPELARDVLELLDRSTGSGGRIEAAIRAAVALEMGDAKTALAVMAPHTVGGAASEPDLLLLQAQAHLLSGGSVPAAVLSALDHTIGTMPDSPGLPRRLRLVRIEAQATGGHPVEALRALRRLGVEDPDVRDLAIQILASVPTASTPDISGIASALENSALLAGPAAHEVRLAYADILSDGGVPNAVEGLLVSENSIPDAETSIAVARARMRTSDPSGALAIISDLPGAEAAAIRNQALLWLGQGRNLAQDEQRKRGRLARSPGLAETGGGLEASFAVLAAYISGGNSTPLAALPNLPTLDQAEAALANVSDIRSAVEGVVKAPASFDRDARRP
ncbi:hypothetical protein ACW9UR_11725 [Halovulum sp. GXIMD14794]